MDLTRPVVRAGVVAVGPRIAEREIAQARDMAAALRTLCGAHPKIGVERMNAGAALALADATVTPVDAQAPVVIARSKPTPEDAGKREVHGGSAAHRHPPGQTEAKLGSVLHRATIARNGHDVGPRLLNSGPRTTPWFGETGRRVSGSDDLIALDTDVMGCPGCRFAILATPPGTFPKAPTLTAATCRRMAAV